MELVRDLERMQLKFLIKGARERLNIQSNTQGGKKSYRNFIGINSSPGHRGGGTTKTAASSSQQHYGPLDYVDGKMGPLDPHREQFHRNSRLDEFPPVEASQKYLDDVYWPRHEGHEDMDSANGVRVEGGIFCPTCYATFMIVTGCILTRICTPTIGTSTAAIK